jgi:hypothetical protein
VGGGNPILYARDDFSTEENLETVAALYLQHVATDRGCARRSIQLHGTGSIRNRIYTP